MSRSEYVNFIESLNVGEDVNINSFNNILFDELETIDIYPANIKTNDYAFTIDGSPAILVDDYLPLEFDQYLELTSFTLNLS